MAVRLVASTSDQSQALLVSRIAFWIFTPLPSCLRRYIRGDPDAAPVLSITSGIWALTSGLRASIVGIDTSAALEEVGIAFSYPKPSKLLEYLVEIGSAPGDLILDFFAGSGTTAQAVLDLNARENSQRRFILIQLPEPMERSDYPTIADLAEERVRRVIRKLNDAGESKLNLNQAEQQDRGFRLFRLTQSNVKEWDAAVAHETEAVKEQLELSIDHIRTGRTDLDIVYEVLLKSGYRLSSKVESETVNGRRIYSVGDGAFLICLERDLTLDLIRSIAARKAERVLFLDEGFAGNDQLKTNAVQTFKTKNVVFRTL